MDKASHPKLFYSTIIDSKEEVEEKLDKARTVLHRIVSVGSEREVHDALQSAVCRDKQAHDDVSLGLLANILTDGGVAQKCFRDLTFVTRDNMGTVIETLVTIATEKYHKLTDISRAQMIWMTKELVRVSMAGADGLCWNLMRQIAGGDISNRNLWLAENMLETFIENRPWLEKHPILIGAAIFTYLRILEDHFPAHLSNLRQKEVNFVVGLIRDHFSTVVMNPSFGMGRDFVRLLQGVSRIPEIQAVWVDLFYNPKTLAPHFNGVAQLLNIRTARKFLQCRLTPEMEKKIGFLTTNVMFGNHKRYQEWFQRQFLATPESQTLRADIIRFIVGVIHPPNEILCSNILPRWAVIGWLLTTCTSPVAAANAKLALFFDWLSFDPVKDNIMNIEPGILVMFHSMKNHLAITVTLIDFLIRQITEFWPEGTERIKEGIGAALRTILEKKVLASLDPMLENPKLESDLRTSIQEVLVPLLRREKNGESAGEDNNGSLDEMNNHIKSEPLNVPVIDVEPGFSDDDDDDDDGGFISEEKVKPLAMSGSGFPTKGSPTMGSTSEEAERSKIFELVQTLAPNMRIPLESMLNNPSADKGENLDEVLDECTVAVPVEKDQREALVKALIYLYRNELTAPCVDEEETVLVEDSICASPVVEIMTQILQCKPSDKTVKIKNLSKILCDIVQAMPRVAYKILLLLHQLSTSPDGPATREEYYPSLYKNLCNLRGLKLEQALRQDVKSCWELEPVAMGLLCPILYEWFASECKGSTDILRMVVSTIDSSQLQDIVWRIAQQDFTMILQSDLQNMISKTLDWETWEQHCVWTILAAHQFDIDEYLPVIATLDYKKNAEALTAMFLKLKSIKPTEEILSPCLCRKPNPKDRFVLSLLICWTEIDMDCLAEHLTTILVKACGSPVKRKRGANAIGRAGTSSPAGPVTPSLENVLAHLELLREQVEEAGVFNTDRMQAGLLQLKFQSYITDAQRNKYKALLALSAIEESSEIKESRSVVKRATTRKPASPTGSSSCVGSATVNSVSSPSSSSSTVNNASTNRTTRSGRATRQAIKDDSDSSSSSSSSDEDEAPSRRNLKRRKRASALNSDSD